MKSKSTRHEALAVSDKNLTVCGARTSVGPCVNPPEPRRRRCRLHGGAKGSGAPSGRQNGRYRNGENTKVAKSERRWAREMIKGGLPSEVPDAVRQPIDLKIATGPVPGTFLLKRSENDGIRERLMLALGSKSPAFIETALHRLILACNLPAQSGVSTEIALNSALALIESLEPSREVEAAVAVDIACLHAAASNMLARLSGRMFNESIKTAANSAAKLEQAFHSAVKTYDLLKRGRRQDIHVHHVHMPGSQTLIGDVHTAG